LTKEPDIGKNTLTSIIVMGCTLASRVLGFVRLIVVTTFFGQAKADVINLAFSVPNNLRKLLAEGALSSAFIPVLSSNLVQSPDGSRARRLVSSIVTFQILVILPLCILSIIFSDGIIRVLAEFRDPDQLRAASRLFRLVINYLLLISISAVLMGVLNAHRRFVVPAFAPILFSVSVIVAISLLNGTLDIYAMAVGVLAGGVAQILFQYPLYRSLGYRFRLVLDRRNPEFRKIMRQWLPILATSSVFTITQQVAFRFASGLEGGSVTAVSIALVFFQLPFGIFSASITNVLFPRMSSQAARNDTTGLIESMQYGLRFLSAALVPSGLFLCFMSTQLISVGFLRGAFTQENVDLAGPVLVYYGIGLLSVGAFSFLQRVLYSLNEYRIPFGVASVVAAADIALSLWLKETILKTGGIALANSISFTFGTILLLAVIRRKIGPMRGRSVAVTLLKVSAAGIPGVLILVGFRYIFGPWWEAGRTLTGFLMIFAVAALFSLVVLGGYRVMKVQMLQDITARIKKVRNG
jgi:putative peptidoglycan lipid II flippase